MVPAVGMLIFAGYLPSLKEDLSTHLFCSPRPCPHSGPEGRPGLLSSEAPHCDVEGWPPVRTAFTSWLQSGLY